MNLESTQRHFRKKLVTHGLIFFGGEEQEIMLKNISVTGALAQLEKTDSNPESLRSLFATLQMSMKCDWYVPKLHIAGEADIVRIDMDESHILLALEFTNVSYNIDNRYYKRRVYRKSLTVSGTIVFNDEKLTFKTINVSVEGLMIEINKAIDIEDGLVTSFELNYGGLRGDAKVMWVEQVSDTETLIGLQYLNMKTRIMGIPRFEQ
jgi:hypothetical protein